jgi:hypothetical protein
MTYETENVSPQVEPTEKKAPAVKKRNVAKKTSPVKKVTVKKAAKKSAKKTSKKTLVKSTKATKATKTVKTKLIRDSFAIPEKEYAALVAVKKTCLKAGLEIKKTELIRIGIALVNDLTTAKIKTAQAKLTQISAGRPKK